MHTRRSHVVLLALPLLLTGCTHARGSGAEAAPATQAPAPMPEDVLAEAAGQTVIAKCILTARGTTERCRVLRGLSDSAAASLVRYLEARRQEPAVFEGKPVDVDYTYNIILKPRAPAKPPESDVQEVLEADPTLVLPPDVVEAAAGQTLVLRCLITAEGAAQECRTLEGPAAAAAGAARYLETQRFKPMMLGDKPVSMERSFTFRFKAQEESTPAPR